MAVLVSDSFNRADSATTLGTTDSYNGGTAKTWTMYGGSIFGISGNQAYNTGGGGGDSQLAGIDVGVSDVTYYMTLSVMAGVPVFIIRASAANSHIMFQAKSTGYFMYTYTGSYTQIGSTTAKIPASGDAIKIVCSGTSITVYINGTQYIAVTSSFNQTATIFGMNAQGNTTVRYDNFQIESLSSGTTYSGGGTASGVSSASSTEVQIYAGTGTTSGVGSASSSETVIAASTIYSGSGTASGTSNASSTQTVTFASSGTAQGSASVVGSVAVPTTYTGSGIASGIASVIARELLLSARGTPLKRAYVFQDQSSLVATQVDVNFKTLFDYLGSQVIGIGMVIASGATIASITGIVQNDTQYLVTVIPSWNTTCWITGKTTSGFTINFGTAPASTSTLDWRLMR